MTGAVVVAGAAGGCGATLVAGGLALCWAAAGARPWLVELDLDRGDLAGSWGVAADRTIADLAPVAAELDGAHLRAAAFPHPSGVSLLPAPGRPGAAAAWGDAGLVRLVGVAAAEGQVVIDAGALGSAGLAAAGRAGGVLIVCPPTVAGARRARRQLDALAAVGAADRAAVVVGARPGRREIAARALGRALATSVVAELPWAEGEAADLGAGRWSPGRRRRLHRGVAALAEAIG